MIEGIQKSLFKTGPLSDSRLVAKTKLEILGRNLDDAFGVTKTGLCKGSCDVLRYIFRGIHNLDLELFLEMLSIENPAEILSPCFAAGRLKKGNRHLENPNIPRDFLELKNFLNKYSYNKGFANLASKFKEYFDSGPWEQVKRLELLEQSMKDVRDIGGEFVKSFFSSYRISDEENSFIYDFHAPRSKEGYVNIIYDELESLSERAKQI